ncbi:MAG TPA: hypothetical protein VF060_19360 [Trebonia sp.]
MAELPDVHAQTLLVLAEHGSHEAATAALGIAASTFRRRLREARSAFLVLWHEHEAPSGTWRRDRQAERALRRQPPGLADAARALGDIGAAYGGRTRIASTDLLARLAAADPARYGEWNHRDLGGFLRRHDVGRHKINIDGDRSHQHWGYWLEEITGALAALAAPGAQDTRPLAA